MKISIEIDGDNVVETTVPRAETHLALEAPAALLELARKLGATSAGSAPLHLAPRDLQERAGVILPEPKAPLASVIEHHDAGPAPRMGRTKA